MLNYLLHDLLPFIAASIAGILVIRLTDDTVPDIGAAFAGGAGVIAFQGTRWLIARWRTHPP